MILIILQGVNRLDEISRLEACGTDRAWSISHNSFHLCNSISSHYICQSDMDSCYNTTNCGNREGYNRDICPKQVKMGYHRIRYLGNYFGRHCSCLPCWDYTRTNSVS